MANEKRLDLIDRKALGIGYCNPLVFDKTEYAHGWNCAIEILMNAPTVDAVELVHGVWVVEDYDSGDPGYYSAFIEVHCSKCGYELGAESGQYGWCYGDPFPLNYCPNCGAKMDGDGNERA